MLIKNIFMELRSRLRSCNVYITTGVDFSKNCNLKISIQSNCIVLNYYDDCKLKRNDSLSSIESLSDCDEYDEETDVTAIIPIAEFCYIIPNSMSCLKINQNTISFRILTEPKNGGNFFNELLAPNKLQEPVQKNELKINVKANDELKFICRNCSNVVSEESVKFDRVLELPSVNMDLSEWFCHAHVSKDQEDVLKPNKKDFLYRLTFFMINKSSLAEKTNKFNSKRDVYHCNRCLAWLGLKSKDSVKLFNTEVKIIQNGVEQAVFSHKTPSDDMITDDFIFTIEKMTREFNLGLQYTVMCKIVLECAVSTNNKQYLLIWVMDRELQVLKNVGEFIENDKIKLQSNFLTKILFKVESSLNEEVETWLADPGVVSTDISKNMFLTGVEHLQKMSQKVPECFRNTNGYCVSYLKV
ncbi:hypothetical protein ABMA27_010146 [Loxostege sticticalis]|uniref:E3 ubiquitin-protein ligase E3D n=1 Tax=Loxostege sticticalis TaxID=481309 RepID=A0ABR3H4S2_LOXSC